jgi:TonB family protein
MKRVDVNRKSIFHLLIFFMLLMHLGLLALKLHYRIDQPKDDSRHLIVKLKSDPFRHKTQIVQSEDSDSKKKMDDAYLSDKDRFFDREVRARNTDPFKSGENAGGTPKYGKKKVKLSDLGVAVGEDPFKKAAEEYTDKKNGVHPDKTTNQASSTNDYLRDVPLGDMTNLNTVEYKYYGFYHRIRQKLEQFWGRSLHEKANQMLRYGRRVPASEELITSLEITLDSKGDIIAIKIMGSSGIKELDDAAIESFNEAGPFPNPPKGLVVNGKVTLEWGFVVES